MTAEVGLPACRSVLAHVEDRHADVVAELIPIRTILARFGGSHAQRGALQRTLVVSAIRSGQLQLARSLVDERLAVRETSVWSWQRRNQVLTAAGDRVAADRANQQATAHAARFAAAAAEPTPRSRRRDRALPTVFGSAQHDTTTPNPNPNNNKEETTMSTEPTTTERRTRRTTIALGSASSR